jgi:8-oxo-dGTP diphosphatase
LTFITRGDEVLFIRGAPTKRLWANQYNGIGGHIEAGEDVLSGARRELEEETGLRIANLWLAGITTIDTNSNPGVVLFIFRGECGLEQRCLTKSTEEGSLEWVMVSDVSKLNLVDDLKSLLPIILSVRSEDQPISAHYSFDALGKIQISIAQQ